MLLKSYELRVTGSEEAEDEEERERESDDEELVFIVDKVAKLPREELQKEGRYR